MKIKQLELRDWLLPMLINGQAQVNSNLNLNSKLNDAAIVDSGLGRVAEGGMEYKKGK